MQVTQCQRRSHDPLACPRYADQKHASPHSPCPQDYPDLRIDARPKFDHTDSALIRALGHRVRVSLAFNPSNSDLRESFRNLLNGVRCSSVQQGCSKGSPLRTMGNAALALRSETTGSLRVNREPTLGSDSTTISPSSVSVTRLLIARPMPLPSYSLGQSRRSKK